MSKTIELNKDNFNTEVLESAMPILVDFWAPWCVPCKMMAETLEELAEEMADKVKVAKLNTDEGENQDLARKYEIQSIPNMKLFRDGKVIAEFVGLRNKETLQKEIEAAL